MLEIDVELARADFRLTVRERLDAPLTGVFGPSGAGKSTLLRLVAGIERPDRGRVALDGVPFVDTASGVFVPAHRRGVGVVFQDGRLFPHRSVRGNLRFAEGLAPRRARRHSFDEVTDLLELGALLDRRPAVLSGGERQRVALARALLAAPRLLLLDEPLASLDRGRRRAILPYLARLRDAAGVPILYVSHDLGEILHLTPRLLVLDGGRSLGHGPFLDLAMDPEVLARVHDLGLVNVLPVRVVGHDPAEGITHLAPRTERAEPSIVAPLCDRPIGAETCVALRPEDIALVLGPVGGISMQNQIDGRIERVAAAAERVLCLVRPAPDLGLLVEVTHHAVHTLGLRPGLAVRCLFKAQALRYVDGGSA